MWRVTGTGIRTGAEFVYRVDAPADAAQMDVVMSACREHGRNIQNGTADETLNPARISAEIVK
jgi:hypothetical protein